MSDSQATTAIQTDLVKASQSYRDAIAPSRITDKAVLETMEVASWIVNRFCQDDATRKENESKESEFVSRMMREHDSSLDFSLLILPPEEQPTQSRKPLNLLVRELSTVLDGDCDGSRMQQARSLLEYVIKRFERTEIPAEE